MDCSGLVWQLPRLTEHPPQRRAGPTIGCCAGSGRTGPPGAETTEENPMDDEILNLSIRKFLKMVGVNSQREIEQAVAKALASGAAPDACPATMTLEIPALRLKVTFDGDILVR
jgi:hypothetical protein